MIKVGLVGAGFIGMQHLEAIGRIPGAKVVAISGRNLDNLNYLKEKGLCERVYTNYKDMIDSESLDVLHNCTPTGMHYEINKYALENNINVFGEKPLVKTLEEAEELVKLARDKKLVTGMNFNYRNNLLVQEMHSRISNSEFGRVLFVQGEYLQDWLMFESDYDWRLDVNVGGPSRALADIGSHCIDLMQYVLSSKVVEVNAKLFTVHEERKKYENVGTFSQVNEEGSEYELLKVENEDGGVIQAKFENGVIGSFVISQISAGKKNGLSINVSGEKYALEWHQERSDRLWVGHRDRGNEEIYADAKYVSDKVKDFATLPNGHPVGWHDATTNGIRMFYKAVEEKDYYSKQPFATFEDGYYIMKVIDACLESDKKESWITI